ncbi:MAG TPA: non-canonical purine NTP pyrophosphatase [Actinobacteria bacterium]|nr:non-canonical purine NTP pyrophosphatase [Actinomycetota bacterium]
MEIVIATKNKGKVREISHFFKDTDISFKSLNDYPEIPEIIEDGNTFEENAIIKAKTTAEILDKTVIADDSGLQVDYLNGRPGVYSSRYSGINADDRSNRIKLLNELNKEKNTLKRTARFVCSMVLWDSREGLIFKTSGICEGTIGFEEKGEGGFGYDSIFIPSGFEKTMAQLTNDEKNRISHRGKALLNLSDFLKTNYIRK